MAGAPDLKINSQTLYEILEVSEDATAEEIRQAFMKAKATYSVDNPALYSVFTKEEAEELMHVIEDAYAVLSDPTKRNAYDEAHANTKKQSGPALKVIPNTKIKSEDRVEKATGHSAYSHYVVDNNFEKEIAEQTIYDGSFLQKVRVYKNINVDQLTKSTRIGRQYLLAIEGNDFHSLPAPVFVRGFIVQIARALNINEQKAAESFMKLFKQSREK